MLPWLRRDLALDDDIAWAECSTAIAARAHVEREHYDFIVLERNIIDASSLTLASELRALDATRPIIMLADCGCDRDIVAAIDAGVDEYIVRPVAIAVIRAHLRRLLRRSAAVARDRTSIVIGDATIDVRQRTITNARGVTTLTTKEALLLECLINARERIVSRAELLERVWGYRFDPQTSVFDVALLRVRRKLAAVCPASRIEARRGLGFRFIVDEQRLNEEKHNTEASSGVKARRNSGEQNVSLR